MKQMLLTLLRNVQTPREQFRDAAHKLSEILAYESAQVLSKTQVSIETPLASMRGERFEEEIVLIPILRSGLAMLPAFLRVYPNALVGLIGTVRDEATAKPSLYYSKLPPLRESQRIFLLDPMIATGGSAGAALQIILGAGISQEKIGVISFLAAPEGLAHLQNIAPHARVITVATDEKLSTNKWILPGLGDFGDRYFGTV